VFCFAEVEIYTYNGVHTVSQFETDPRGKGRLVNGFCAAARMPFARPETALASTIDPKLGSKVGRGKTMRPAACEDTSTTFQRLPRRLNDLQKGASAGIAFRSGRAVSVIMQSMV
jgi:hypothetical protein